MLGKRQNLLIPIAVVCLCLSLFMTRVDLGSGRVWVFMEGLLLGFAFALSVFRIITLALTESYE
jgi:hypothetical protein